MTTLLAGPGVTRADGLVRELTKKTAPLIQEDALTLHAARLEEKGVTRVVYLPGAGPWKGMRSQAHAVRELLAECQKAKVKKFVLVSCHRVYGATPQHNLFLPDDTPVAEDCGDSFVTDLANIDRACTEVGEAQKAMKVVVLRPVYVLGDDFASELNRYLNAAFLPRAMGFNPSLQLMHERDLYSAISLALSKPVTGAFNVTGSGELPLSILARERGRQQTTLLGGLGQKFNEWMVQAGRSTYPNSRLPYLMYVISVDGSKFAQKTGYAPAVPLQEIVTGMRAQPSDSIAPEAGKERARA